MSSSVKSSFSSLMFGELIQKIDEGRLGLNTGLSTGIKPLDEGIGGIQKKTYTLIFGAEGAGKSVFTTHAYILSPLMEHFFRQKNDPDYLIDLKVYFYSLEVDRVNVLGKMLCWIIYKETGRVFSMKYLFSNRLFLIDNTVYDLVMSYKPLIERMLDEVLTIIDKPMTALEINEETMDLARDRGTSKIVTLPDGKRLRKYTPNNPYEHVLIIVDTLTNLTVDDSIKMNSEKKECDRHSSFCKHVYRNLLHYSIINVTHSNRDISNAMRTKSGEIYPNKNDISISSQPARDADLVIVIFATYEYANPNNNLGKFEGYDITRLKHRYRNIGVLKSRDGENMLRISVLFVGECGYFKALPKTLSKQDYIDILSIKMEFEELNNHTEKRDLIKLNQNKTQ
jgi:replicative DNA helicase